MLAHCTIVCAVICSVLLGSGVQVCCSWRDCNTCSGMWNCFKEFFLLSWVYLWMSTLDYQSVNYCRTWHLHIFTCLCKMFNSSMIVWKVESWSSFSSAELRRWVTQKSRIASFWWGLYCDSINSTSRWKIFPVHLFYQWIYLHFSNLMQILYCNIGNPHSLGQQPVTFFREVSL
jgi:hypothetical protein